MVDEQETTNNPPVLMNGCVIMFISNIL